MKIKIIAIVFVIYIMMDNKAFALSDKFKYIIDTIEIPEFNVQNKQINEDVYYTYNVFCYSSPTEMKYHYLQRFKEVQKKGKWEENCGSYKGSGKRGEYYILGQDYNGDAVTNVYFPPDYIPETTPDKWKYVYMIGASNSWNNKTKYKYIEQLDFMKNTNLLFDKVNYEENTIDPYELVEYDINANKIGLSNVTLNTCSTWKTIGVVSINRMTNSGQKRYATLITPPIAANAQIKSFLNCKDEVKLDKKTYNMEIEFGAKVVNLNKYAKKEHIKKINSKLYINGVLTKEITSSKADIVNSKIKYVIKYKEVPDTVSNINLKVVSYMYTEFNVDGLYEDVLEKNITIQKNKLKDVPVKNASIKSIEKQNNEFIVAKLIHSNETINTESKGISQLKRHVALKVVFEDEVESENVYVKLNNKMIDIESILQKDNVIIYDIFLQNNIGNTLTSWGDIRGENYFNSDFKMVGKRKSKPNKFSIVSVTTNNILYEVYFDTLSDFENNINYTFNTKIKKQHIKDNDSENTIKLADWVNDDK